jgi:uncharacterized MnhB-related membrane protein
MTPLHLAALAAVVVAGTATVLVRHPLRQVLVAGVFGVALAVLFLVFGAPDVALSEIGVATVVVPVLALVTLSKMDEERDR